MLTGKQRSYLRGEGNTKNPIVHIGKDGISTGVIEQIDKALDDHELIKVRVLENSGEGIKKSANMIAENCKAEVVQTIGNIFLLYRRNDEEPIYNLPQ